jgi:hypothetical protein
LVLVFFRRSHFPDHLCGSWWHTSISELKPHLIACVVSSKITTTSQTPTIRANNNRGRKRSSSLFGSVQFRENCKTKFGQFVCGRKLKLDRQVFFERNIGAGYRWPWKCGPGFNFQSCVHWSVKCFGLVTTMFVLKCCKFALAHDVCPLLTNTWKGRHKKVCSTFEASLIFRVTAYSCLCFASRDTRELGE